MYAIADPGADAAACEVLTTERVFAAAGTLVIGDDNGSRELRGFSRPIHTFNVEGTDSSRAMT